MAKKIDMSAYAPTVLRIFLGLLLLIPGLMKIMSLISTGTLEIIGLLGDAIWLAWVLAIVEVIVGIALVIGWQVRTMVWPYIVIMVVAIILAQHYANPMQLLWHLSAIGGLISLYLSGAGAWALDES